MSVADVEDLKALLAKSEGSRTKEQAILREENANMLNAQIKASAEERLKAEALAKCEAALAEARSQLETSQQ